ncbi:MAG TPA: ABC transporter substrate-binding protein [Anaeromyxobacteraceae bacterium]|jgi:branched-chain amino acid transport system substrate-binding protein
MRRPKSWLFASLAVVLAAPTLARAQAPAAPEARPFKLGVVTFLSGPAAGPFGVPARNAAEVLVEALNGGKVPAPYAQKGLGGRTIEVVFIDEAGGPTTQVSEYRNLVQRQNVDAVIGYISSGDCLAIAPVAEELKKLTLFFDCGTPRIFEDAAYRYVFRTAPHATMDNVAAALYVTEVKPRLKKVAGINQNYAWGQDSWADFELTMKQLRPDVKVTTSQMPKLYSGQYGAEISALMSGSPEVIHSSFWDGDLDAFVLQASPRGLFKKSTALLTAGETAMYKLAGQIPDGTIIGARGPNGVYAPDNALNRWFRATYQDRFTLWPVYPSYRMAQAILGLKSAYEKAQGGGPAPDQDKIIAALEGLTFESPSGTVRLAIGKGHQAVSETAYGTAKNVGGKLTLTNVKRYPAEKVNPPEGVKSADWIKATFKPAR